MNFSTSIYRAKEKLGEVSTYWGKDQQCFTRIWWRKQVEILKRLATSWILLSLAWSRLLLQSLRRGLLSLLWDKLNLEARVDC